MMRVSSQLLKGLKGDEREKYKEYLAHNADLLRRIVKLLKDDLECSVASMREVSAYDTSSWPFFQADKLGEQRAIAKMIGILSLDREGSDDD